MYVPLSVCLGPTGRRPPMLYIIHSHYISLLSRAKRVTLYLRSSFSMMYPQGPQLYTQGFPELVGGGGGGGGDFVRWT